MTVVHILRMMFISAPTTPEVIVSVSLRKSPIISDGQARRIAAEWQAPNSPGIASLATSGAILDVTQAEVQREIDWFDGKVSNEYTRESCRDLLALRAYVINRGVRTAPEGWHRLWDDTPVA